MSENLKLFLADWLAWTQDGAPPSLPFTRYQGLCTNFGRWYRSAIRDDYEAMHAEVNQFKDLLVSEGLDEDYPFGGEERYLRDCEHETMHRNKARIDWVRSKVEQFATT